MRLYLSSSGEPRLVLEWGKGRLGCSSLTSGSLGKGKATEEGYLLRKWGWPEHHGDNPQCSWVCGAGGEPGGFPGSPAPLGGARLGPGRQLASCNPAISRRRSWVVVGGCRELQLVDGCCLCVRGPSRCPRGVPRVAGRPQADRALDSWEGMQSIGKARKTILTVKSYCWTWVWTTQVLLSSFSDREMKAQRDRSQQTANWKELGPNTTFIWRAGAQGGGSLPGTVRISMQATPGAAQQSRVGKMTSGGRAFRGLTRSPQPVPAGGGGAGWGSLAQPVLQPVWAPQACEERPGTTTPGLLLLSYSALCPGRLLI